MIFPQQGLLINKHWYIFRGTISASMQLTEIVLTHDTAVPALIPRFPINRSNPLRILGPSSLVSKSVSLFWKTICIMKLTDLMLQVADSTTLGIVQICITGFE